MTAADCVASLKRWSVRDPLGKMLMADTASLEAKDARTFEFVLKQPFPLMLDVLGKPNAPLPVIMPARIAATPADQRIPEPIGSGPFRFVKDQWRPGNTMLLERNPDYKPRDEPPDFLAGGKKVKIDQLTLRVMPDQSTGANALMAGEIDYMQYLPFDMLPILEKEKSVKLMGLGGIHQFQGNFRLNHAFPPFDNPAVRKVMWKLVDQDATLTAIGVPEQYRAKSCSSFWMCGTPLTTDAGAERQHVRHGGGQGRAQGVGLQGRAGDHPRGRGLDQPDRLAGACAEHAGRRASPSSSSRATGRPCWRGAPRRRAGRCSRSTPTAPTCTRR